MELIDLSTLSEVINTLGWTLVHFTWQGVALGVLFICLDSILRKSTAGARYLTGLFCLFLAFLTPMLTFAWLSGQPAAIPATVSSADALSGIMLTQQATLWDVLSNNIEYILPWIVMLWGIGVSSLSVRALIGWRLVQLFRSKDVHLSPDWINDRVNSLASSFGIRQTITVMQSLRVQVPTVIGWLKPVILLPVSVINRLDRDQLEMVLAHELGHIRRYDYIVNLLQVFLETVLFYHPVVRWMSNRIRQERENCCDDLVIETCGKPVVYAKALASLEEARSTNNIEPAVAATGGDLLARVKRIVHGRQSGYRPVKGSLLLASVVALVSALGAQSNFISNALPDFEIASVSSNSLEADSGDGVMPNRAAWLQGLALLPEYTARAAAAKAAEKAAELAASKAAEQAAINVALANAAAEEAPAKSIAVSTEPEPKQPVHEAIDQPVALTETPVAQSTDLPAGIPAPEERYVLSIVPTRMIAPKYPVKASQAGIEGFVKLEFSLNKRGRVKNIEIVDAYPADVFNRDAVRAMKGFRFKKPDALIGAIRLTQTFDFVLSDDPDQLADSSKCTKLGNGYCAGLAIGSIQVVESSVLPDNKNSENPEKS